MYQQRPFKSGGTLINRGSFEMLESEPPGIDWAWGWDTAYTAKQIGKANPDFSVGVRGGLWYPTPDYCRVVIAEVVYVQQNWREVWKLIRDCARRFGRGTQIGVGAGGAKSAVADLLTDPLLMGYAIRAIPESTDKVARAQPWISRAATGWLCVVEGAWNSWYFDWLEVFPFGAKDDPVDATSVLWEMLFTADDSETTEQVEVQREDLGYWDNSPESSLGDW